MTPPPERLTDPEERACFFRVQSRLRSRGEWHDEFAIGLWPLAVQCVAYLRFARQVRALENVDSLPADAWSDALKELEKGLEETHRIARVLLVDFWMIPAARMALCALTADGLDSEIAALCAPLAPEELRSC